MLIIQAAAKAIIVVDQHIWILERYLEEESCQENDYDDQVKLESNKYIERSAIEVHSTLLY